MQQAANGEVRPQETLEFLPDQIRPLASQDDASSTQVGFSFVQSGFYLPSLVI